DSLLQGCLPGTNVYQGALGYYESPASTDGHLFLLDFHPSATPNDFKNGALLPGESWSDPYSPISLNVTNANSSGMSVSVSYNQPCQAAVASAATYAASSASGSIFVTAPADCSWQASSGTSWINFTGATSGTGNGFVPFTLTDNTDAEQRLGFVTVSRVSVAVSQKGAATYIKPMSPSLGSGVQAVIPFVFDDPLGSNDVNYARFFFGNSEQCEIDMSQSSGFVGFFVWDATTQTFSPFIAPGDNVTYGTSACSLTGTGTTVARVGNQLQVSLNMSFNLNFAGSHRVAVSACDGAFTFGCSSDITLGTWQVPLAAAINQLTPNTGKQGTSLSVTAFGTNTHFADTSSIVVSGTGVTVTGISAFSPTQISGTFNIDAAAPAGQRTVTITTGTEVLTTSFTVGASGQVSVAPGTLTFAKQAVGTTSAAQPLTLTNTGSAALGISSINAVGEFGATHNCGMSLAVGASCTINVTFSPLLGGYRHGNVIINDDSAGAPHFIALTGLGEASVTILRPDRSQRFGTTSMAQGGVRSLSVMLPASRSADSQVTCKSGGALACSVTGISYGVAGTIYDLEVRSLKAAEGRYDLRLLMQDGRLRRSFVIPVEVKADSEDDNKER
ncbi:MAG TPA: choice-of-anchor D domain-containing protein, partial [Terriglobales bacterium]|nr:choice-of-anchor D domain-containing protein [Terriglobales bacterium]